VARHQRNPYCLSPAGTTRSNNRQATGYGAGSSSPRPCRHVRPGRFLPASHDYPCRHPEPLTITRKGGKVVAIPLAPRTNRAIELATGERCDGPIFLPNR
jgi:hypothetical protein